MSGPFDCQQLGPARYRLSRSFQLFNRAEAVSCAVHEKRRSTKVCEVRSPQLWRVLWRVQRVRKQEKRVCHARLAGCEHRSLPPPIRMPAQKNPSGHGSAQYFRSPPKALLVAFRAALHRRSLGTRLTKWQVASQYGHAAFAKCSGHRLQQRRFTVSPGPVRQHQPVARRVRRHVQIPAHRRLSIGCIFDPSNLLHRLRTRKKRVTRIIRDTDMRKSEKQNVTVSLDRQTVRKAKILAARRSTSISGLLARQIEILVGEEEAYERAERTALDLLDRGFHMGGVIRASRDELHER